MEHLQHFGLGQDPFSNEPDLRFYFESASHRDAQRRVERGLRQHKGLTLLTGDGGMGKTLLARRILDSLEEEIFEATLLVILPGAADATGILQRFARQIGCEEPAADRAGLLGQIYEHLAIVREDGRHAVLMIDDAQILTPDVFAELGGLLNLEYEDRRLLSILFVGTHELDRLVQNDASIMPRVDVRVRLQALDMDNTTAYLIHRLTSVRGNPEIIPAAAIDSLYKFGRGRPRLLNTLADNALFEAYLSGRPAIFAGDVERAAADLGIGSDPGTTFSQLSMAPVAPPAEFPDSSLDEIRDSPGPELMPPTSLDLDEPVADFDLTPEMVSAPEAPRMPAALDLDAGFDAALEGFGGPSSTGAEDPGLGLELLDFEIDPDDASSMGQMGQMDPLLEAMPLEAKPMPADPREHMLSEPEFALADAEFTTWSEGDGDDLADAFVELIEE